MADIKYLDKTGLGTVKSILEGLFSPKGHKHTVADITNFPSSLPASDVYSWAKAETKPAYTFNEINPGNATIGDGANSLFLRTNASWASSIYHHTSSDEAVVFLNKGKNVSGTSNYTTSWIFAYGTPADRPAWTSLTPALQIKGECVAINKLIGSQKGGSYNLDVNGSANATTLYENGTRVALSGHNHDDRYYTEGEIDTKLSGKSNTGHGHSGIGDGALVHMCSLYAQATYNAYKIITNWNKASNYMPTINIRGYAYGSQKTIDCDIVMYHYNSEPCNYSITNKGSYEIKVYSAIENNVQVFYIEPGEYFGMFNVFVYGGMGTGNFTGWTMETASAVSGTELPKNAIATNVTGNAGSATKLETARTITIGNTGKSFNGQSNVSWTLSEIGAAASHEHPYLPLTGGTMEGNVTWKSGTGGASCFPAHIYRNTYDNDGNVYDHYYKFDTSSTNSFANLRVKSGTSFKLLRFGGDGTFTWDNKTVSLAGHGHTKSQITDFPSSLPANGGNADTVGGKGVSDFARFYLSPMSSGAPADSAKSWFTDTMPSGSGAIVYNVPGAEKTIIAGKSSGAFGHMLQLNYDDNYLRILRYYSGSWKTTDWEKISAGYADTAGSAVDQTARNSAAAKWTWNADEIKAVKVNNASSADSATKATQDSDGNTINTTYLKLEGGTMTGNILLGNGNAILGSGNSIPSKFKDSASISPEVHSVWLAAVGTGTGNAAGSEASGILFDGNTVKMWSPLDSDPQIIDSDNGAAYTLLHSGNISSYAITSLSGYATQDWVTNKGYTTATGHNHSGSYYDATISRTKNTVLAAPNGSNGVAVFRSLVAADIPSKLGTTTIESSSWGSQLILNRTSSSGSWGPSIFFNYDGTCNGSLTMTSNKLYVGDNGNSRTEVSLVGHTHGYWTWDENTIKGVKINNAGYADSAGNSTTSGDGTITIIPQYNNEINFGGTNESSTLYIGYRAAGSKPIPTGFVFGGSDGSATLTSSGFKKKSSSDSYVLLGGGGHKAISDFLTSLPSHDHDDSYLKLSGGTLSGELTFGDGAQGMIKYSTHTTSGLKGITLPGLGSAGIGIFSRAGKSTDEGGIIITEDSCLIYNSFDAGWGFSIHDKDLNQSDISSDATKVFGITQDKYYAWSRGGYKKEGSSDSYLLLGGGGHKAISDFLTSLPSHTHTKSEITDFPTSLPASDVYSWAKAASKPSYNFGEIGAGVATIGDGSNRIMFRTNASYKNGIYYSTPGNEALVFGTVNPVTSWIFATTDPTSQTAWTSLTPSLQIKNGKVAINKLIASGVEATYNLEVNGNINASNGFFDTSDERLKDFYDDINVDFDKLKAIPKKYFSWKNDENKEIHLGTSAQEIQKVYPEIVNESADGELSVDYSKLSVVALAAVDKLYDKINKIEQALIDKGIL